MFACLAGVALAFLLLLGDGFRAGGSLIALTCGGAAVARAVLPSEWAGTLALRSKWLDVAFLGTLAVAVGVLTASVPSPATPVGG